MKHFALIIFAFLFATTALGKCISSGIFSLSGHATLNRDGLIILEFYGSSQLLIPYLNKKYPIYLKRQREKVPLHVIETCKGEMGITQVVLRPESELGIDKVYALKIDNLPRHESAPGRYNNSSGTWEQLKYKVNTTVDNENPVITGDPEVQKQTYVRLGCGPAIWVFFKLPGQDKSDLFARASITNKTTGKITTCIVNVENGVLKLGHGMCFGTFHFGEENEFEVTFQLMDQSGNRSAVSDAIVFTKPKLHQATHIGSDLFTNSDLWSASSPYLLPPMKYYRRAPLLNQYLLINSTPLL